MSLRFPSLVATLLAFSVVASAQSKPLRVCADPDNLPFSNQRGEGFENQIAQRLAARMRRSLEYKWARQAGRGFVRNVLNSGECDLLLGVPSGFRSVLTTSPYYRSVFSFLSAPSQRVKDYADPRLRKAKIAVQVVGEEYAPPAMVLARHGLVGNVIGVETVGDAAPALVDALLRKQADLAIVWGPLAAYYQKLYPRRFRVDAGPATDVGIPLAFDIAMAVRKNDVALRDQVEAALRLEHAYIEQTLRSFGVPLLPIASPEERAAR